MDHDSYGEGSDQVKKIRLTILATVAMSAAIAATSAFALPSRGVPARGALLKHVNWGDVAIPGQLCEVSGPIQLHNGRAVVFHSGFGPIVVYTSSVTHGYLRHRLPVAALQIWCATAAGMVKVPLAEGIVVFSSGGGTAHLLGTLTPQYHPASEPFIPYISVARIDKAGHLTTTEFWYAPSNPACCPSGRATTVWKWTGRTFIPGLTKIPRQLLAGRCC
jgi:hypothetical protein